nr:TPA_inf: conotoxin precursor Cerm11 [Conus judaeus]
MAFRQLVTVALLLTLVMSINSAPADQTETGRVSLREDLVNSFPCDKGRCACRPADGSVYSYQCQSIQASAANCHNKKCLTENQW